jgi:hypothetical protein
MRASGLAVRIQPIRSEVELPRAKRSTAVNGWRLRASGQLLRGWIADAILEIAPPSLAWYTIARCEPISRAQYRSWTANRTAVRRRGHWLELAANDENAALQRLLTDLERRLGPMTALR